MARERLVIVKFTIAQAYAVAEAPGAKLAGEIQEEDQPREDYEEAHFLLCDAIYAAGHWKVL